MPYRPYRDFKTPPDRAKLWRYMDVMKLISMFSSGSLFFLRADQLGDSWEGALSPVDVRGRQRKLRQWRHEKMNDRLTACQKEQTRRVYISCWHGNSGESSAMWKVYADKGIAVQTTVKRFKAALDECAEQMIYIAKVEYVDYSETVTSVGHELSPFMHKRMSCAFEQEVRALFREPSTEKGEEEPLGQSGVPVRINVDALIEAIYIAPASEDWEFEAVRSLASKFQLGCKVRRSAWGERAVF